VRNAITRARSTFSDVVAAGGKVTVTTSAGNGGQPVTTVVPPGFDPNQPATVQTHYHGDFTSAASPSSSAPKAMKEMMAANPQQVFVLPEARGNIGGQPTDWGNVTDQARTTRDALGATGITNVGMKVVSAHSAGGRALAGSLNNGHIDANRVALLDCLYEPANSQIRSGLARFGGNVRDISVVQATNAAGRAEAMVRTFPGRGHQTNVSGLHGDGPHDSTIRYYLGGSRLPSANSPQRFDAPVRFTVQPSNMA
jgi:hypothetical protein